MKVPSYTEPKSDCCNAKVRDNTEPTPEHAKVIFWFMCTKCRKPCHVKKNVS